MARALLLVALLWSGPPADPNLHSVSAAKWINSFAGPFIAVLGRFSECPNTKSEHLVRLHLKASQHRNRQADAQHTLQKMTGNISVDVDLTNKGMMYLKAASRSNNQWKENAQVLKFRDGICRSMYEYMPHFSHQIYKVPQADPRKHCVIPKGLYIADETPVNLTVPKMNVFPYGTWRLEVGFDLGTDAKPRNIMCFMAELYTVPKL